MAPELERPARRRGVLIGGVILAVLFIVVVGRWRSSSGTAEPAATEREAAESAAPNVITIEVSARACGSGSAKSVGSAVPMIGATPRPVPEVSSRMFEP